MTDCSYCGAAALEWHENLGCLVNPITGKRHGAPYCKPKQIPLYIIDNGVQWPRNDQKVLNELVNDAVRIGVNPWTFQTVRVGNFVQIKR